MKRDGDAGQAATLEAGAPRRERIVGRLPGGLWLVAWFVLVGQVLFYPRVIAPVVSSAWWDLLVAPSLGLLALAALIPACLKRDGLGVSDVGFRARPSPRETASGAAAGLAIAAAHHAALHVLRRWAGGAAINAGLVSRAVGVDAGVIPGLGLAYSSVVVFPMAEEVVFRGCLLASLRVRWGSGAARQAGYALVSGALFALAHQLGHPLYYAAFLVSGAAFAALYLRTRSLDSVIAAHGAFNAAFLIARVVARR